MMVGTIWFILVILSYQLELQIKHKGPLETWSRKSQDTIMFVKQKLFVATFVLQIFVLSWDIGDWDWRWTFILIIKSLGVGGGCTLDYNISSGPFLSFEI